jgi:hypothetical protein
MAINLESFRYPFESEIANESEGAKIAHRNAFQGILDLNQAIASLKSQQTSTTKTSTTATTTTASTSSGSETVVSNTSTTTIGYVNDQSGVTAYTTVQSDYGKYIILDDASAIAVTLSVSSSSPAITVPWFTSILNYGAGTATLTPINGTISYDNNLSAASMPVPQGCVAVVVYDGTNFWAELIPNIGNVVTQIVAGTNVTISPTSGVGTVTINATGGGSSPIVQSVSFGDGTLSPQEQLSTSTIHVTGESATSVVSAYIVGPNATQPTFIQVSPWWNTTESVLQIQVFNSSTTLSWTYTGASLLVAVWI